MGGWDSFDADTVTKRAGTCGVGVMLNSLDGKAKAIVEGVLSDRSRQHRAIAKALRSRLGADAPSEWSVRNHRAGACRCGGTT